MRYRLNLTVDLKEDDCSYCPCFSRYAYENTMRCGATGKEQEGVSEKGKHGTMVVAYHRPDWCPLAVEDSDEKLALIHDLYYELFDGKPMEMHGEYRKRALAVGADVRDAGW